MGVFALSSDERRDNLFSVWAALMLPIEFVWDWLGVRAIKLQNRERLFGFWALSPLLPALVLALAAISLDDTDEGVSELLLLFRESSALPVVLLLGGIALFNRLVTVGVSVRLFCFFGDEQYRKLEAVLRSSARRMQELRHLHGGKARRERGQGHGHLGPPSNPHLGGMHRSSDLANNRATRVMRGGQVVHVANPAVAAQGGQGHDNGGIELQPIVGSSPRGSGTGGGAAGGSGTPGGSTPQGPFEPRINARPRRSSLRQASSPRSPGQRVRFLGDKGASHGGATAGGVSYDGARAPPLGRGQVAGVSDASLRSELGGGAAAGPGVAELGLAGY